MVLMIVLALTVIACFDYFGNKSKKTQDAQTIHTIDSTTGLPYDKSNFRQLLISLIG